MTFAFQMLIFVDCEGAPIQEFTALYVDGDSHDIVDIFHRYVSFPFSRGYDADHWARQHVHGLNRTYLAANGLRDETLLLREFNEWLCSHPYEQMLANAPQKESDFLQLPVFDVCLPPWKERAQLLSHRLSLSLKRHSMPINGIMCASAHSSFVAWRPRRPYSLSPTDVIKRDYGFHCSLYDCIELYFYHLRECKTNSV